MVRVTVKKADRNIGFPKMMQTDSGLTVLFSSEGEGVVVAGASSTFKLGLFSKYWDMLGFEDFDGSITLSNEG